MGFVFVWVQGNKTEAMMSVMLDRDHLRSKAGLRSLSKTAPGGGPDLVYGTQVPSPPSLLPDFNSARNLAELHSRPCHSSLASL